MIHSLSAVAALLSNGALQAPIILQCPQTAPESWLKWLLPTIVQTVVSLLSIAAGVMIAVWSFRRNRHSEHEQWIRDQKRAEWSAILSALTAAETKLPHVFKGKEWLTLGDEILQDLRNLLPVLRNTLLIADALKRNNVVEDSTKLISEIGEKVMQICGFTNYINDPPQADSPQRQSAINPERLAAMKKRESTYAEIHGAFQALAERLRIMAVQSLTAVK